MGLGGFDRIINANRLDDEMFARKRAEDERDAALRREAALRASMTTRVRIPDGSLLTPVSSNDEIALAFLCPVCANDAVNEDQCCSSCGADSYVVAKADAEDLGRRLKSLGHLEDLLAAWVAQKRAGHRFMTAEERALYDEGRAVVEKRKAIWPCAKESGRG